ncbi:hypothetical protein MMC30_005403 [Trapelia coarctata]|nr:hypothetical protein [Trapelia coarctata]
MVSRPFRLLPSLIPPICALIAFVLSIVTITSDQWAIRKSFSPELNVFDWTDNNTIYTLHRSPFHICSAIADPVPPVDTNNTNADQPPPLITNVNYTIVCAHYYPFGFNRTSCELAIATQNDTYPESGDARLCQQIHFAGNFGIASTTFFGLSFILTLFLTVIAAHVVFRTGGHTPIHEHDNGVPKNTTTTTVEGDSSAAERRLEPTSTTRRRRAFIFSHLNLLLVASLFTGVILALISQFYGILGFIQSAPNNADYATSVGNSASHGPWTQGIALSRYATIAWAFATVAGFAAMGVWRLPSWRV